MITLVLVLRHLIENHFTKCLETMGEVIKMEKTASSLWKWHKRVEATKLTLIHYFTCLCRSVVDIDAKTLASNAPVPEDKISYP